jgi:hypothetical protein
MPAANSTMTSRGIGWRSRWQSSPSTRPRLPPVPSCK